MFPQLMQYLFLSGAQKRPVYAISSKRTYDDLDHLVTVGIFSPNITYIKNNLITASTNGKLAGYYGDITYIPHNNYNIELSDYSVSTSAEFSDFVLEEINTYEDDLSDNVSVSAEFSDFVLEENFLNKAYGASNVVMNGFFVNNITIIKSPDLE